MMINLLYSGVSTRGDAYRGGCSLMFLSSKCTTKVEKQLYRIYLRVQIILGISHNEEQECILGFASEQQLNLESARH